MRQPSPEQLRALRDYAAVYGPRWKSRLLQHWQNENLVCPSRPGDLPLLRQVRNQFGPSWLTRFRLEEVDQNSPREVMKRLARGRPANAKERMMLAQIMQRNKP